MTLAERTRTIKYVRAENSRWLLHRRRDTKKINIPGMQEKKKKRKKRKTKSRKQGTKARKLYSRGLHSNKSSRLCYKAETGTLPHHLPSSCSRRQRYQVSLLPLSSPTPREQINENQQNCLDSGAVYILVERVLVTQVPLISRSGSLPHDLPFHFFWGSPKYDTWKYFSFSVVPSGSG